MTSHLQANENKVILFSQIIGNHNIKNRSCHKCEIKFEPNDLVIRTGHIAHRKVYHKNCFKRI